MKTFIYTKLKSQSGGWPKQNYPYAITSLFELHKYPRHILRCVNHNFSIASITLVPNVPTSSRSDRLRSKVTLRAIFRDVADILFPFGGIFRHGDTSINICAAGTGDHVTRPSATICERGHVRHSELARTMLKTLEAGVWHMIGSICCDFLLSMREIERINDN